jgi:hypothetical protein
MTGKRRGATTPTAPVTKSLRTQKQTDDRCTQILSRVACAATANKFGCWGLALGGASGNGNFTHLCAQYPP